MTSLKFLLILGAVFALATVLFAVYLFLASWFEHRQLERKFNQKEYHDLLLRVQKAYLEYVDKTIIK